MIESSKNIWEKHYEQIINLKDLKERGELLKTYLELKQNNQEALSQVNKAIKVIEALKKLIKIMQGKIKNANYIQ